MTIADLAEERVVEGVYAVKAKRKLRTKSGATYLALELVDPTGRIEARVWNDVELLDGRFGEGDAVRVLGRVERFRDRLQLDVRSLEASDVDPATLTPTARRDRDELDGFLEFLVSEISHPGLAATVSAVLAGREPARLPGDARRPPLLRGRPARAHRRRRHALPRDDAAASEAARRPGARRRARARRRANRRARPRPGLHADRGGQAARARPARPAGDRPARRRPAPAQAAELLHCVAVHHDARAAQTAEASVLYHANSLDAIAATRPVG